MLIFDLHAVTVASLFSRIAEIQRDLGLNDVEFGLALVGIPLGALSGSIMASRMIETIGIGNTLRYFAPIMVITPFLAAISGNGAQLFAALMLFGLTITCFNIAVNVEADRIEADTGTRILNRCHAFWGLWFLLSSLVGALAILAGIQPSVHFTLLLVVVLMFAMVTLGRAEFVPPRGPAADAPKRFALPNRGTYLIGGFMLAGLWIEGSARNWGVIYLRDGYGALDWQAALALPAILLSQTIGRFQADGWIVRFGDIIVARVLTRFTFAGLALIVATENMNVALIGFSMIGLGISTVFPQSVSAAARWGDRPASENVAAFSSLQTMISFAAPPAIGFLAAFLGLRLTFLLFLPLPLMALHFAKYLGPRRN